MVSYAQNGEDVILARAFAADHAGFYIDVGASDPTVDSVTKHFYDHGWSGINVEPAALSAGELRDERPRDVTLELALAAAEGHRRFYELEREMNGCSTFSREIADAYRSDGWKLTERDVVVATLDALYADHGEGREVDFLKIDVEGAEAEVLAGATFTQFRPRIVVVEATVPGTSTPSYQAWEPSVLAAGFSFVLFDGLNRFYVRDEDRALAPALSVPANVLDDYLPFRCWRWRADLQATEAELVTRRNELGDARTALEATATRVSERDTALTLTREELVRSQRDLRDARLELESARLALRNALTGPP
jgi:FkbM family methyltransferase